MVLLHECGLLLFVSPAAHAANTQLGERVTGGKEQESERSWGLEFSGRDWDWLLDHVSYPKSL